MAKKRTSLDSLFAVTEKATAEAQIDAPEKEPEIGSDAIEKTKTKTPIKQPNAQQDAASVKLKGEIVKQTVYLPPAVHEQLRQLAFEERKKMHDYLVEGLDRVFKNRGLKPYVELSDAAK